MRRAVFLDRDGVITVDRGYTHRVEDFELVPGSAQALALLQRAGWRLVVVTNQSGIARGLYTSEDYERFTAHMRAALASEGVRFDAVLHCPHLPDATVASYRQACDCRKPAPGMLLRAAREWSIDLPASAMIGDRLSDVQAGRSAGVGRCLLVRSGQPLRDGDEQQADAAYADLAECAQALVRGDTAPAQ
ncbi:MAG: D-glycero-beta-D-manno-heptose-1,7-bisphosphate 7-phosphatase [Burkholderiaceae bacterium]|nr:D-glycero-beta-D-manno-heptose-1,7-bisphosphate 7-phosphatase [Burkholderiaceae bacterium]